MGRLADLASGDMSAASADAGVWTNRIDVILADECEDDDDRAVMLTWLRSSDISAPVMVRQLRRIGIVCSDRAIYEWRRGQRDGSGKKWE